MNITAIHISVKYVVLQILGHAQYNMQFTLTSNHRVIKECFLVCCICIYIAYMISVSGTIAKGLQVPQVGMFCTLYIFIQRAY